jgi:hypothetical protein
MASEYDLALFREAQAQASQAMEDQLKGLPDVKGTKYIEMGRFEMEVGTWYPRGGEANVSLFAHAVMRRFHISVVISYHFLNYSRCGTKAPTLKSTQFCPKSTFASSASST